VLAATLCRNNDAKIYGDRLIRQSRRPIDNRVMDGSTPGPGDIGRVKNWPIRMRDHAHENRQRKGQEGRPFCPIQNEGITERRPSLGLLSSGRSRRKIKTAAQDETGRPTTNKNKLPRAISPNKWQRDSQWFRAHFKIPHEEKIGDRADHQTPSNRRQWAAPRPLFRNCSRSWRRPLGENGFANAELNAR